jgi:hypothetical protein
MKITEMNLSKGISGLPSFLVVLVSMGHNIMTAPDVFTTPDPSPLALNYSLGWEVRETDVLMRYFTFEVLVIEEIQ